MQDNWLSIIEYARKYNISDITVRRRIKTGRIPAVLRDGKYYIAAQNLPPEYQEAREELIREIIPVRTKEIPREEYIAMRPAEFQKNTYSQPHAHPSQRNEDRHYNDRPRSDFSRQGGSHYQEKKPIYQDSRIRETLHLLEKTVRELKETEKKVFSLYEQKELSLKQEIENLKLTIDNKNAELSSSQRQNEDLRLLIRMIESQTS